MYRTFTLNASKETPTYCPKSSWQIFILPSPLTNSGVLYTPI